MLAPPRLPRARDLPQRQGPLRGTQLSVNESFSDFPLGQGHFGDAFNTTFTPDGGGEGKVAYDITGRVARTRASGTFRVGLTETDPAGMVTTACDSGSVSWSAVTG